MTKLNYIIPTLIVLTLLTVAVLYRPAAISITNNAAQPDAIMEDVTTLIFDKEGKPRLKIVTPRMVHYLENDATDLTTPEVTIYHQTLQPWRITAQYGKSSNGTDEVDFWDNVMIHHTADQNIPNTLIKTATLTVHPELQTAQTHDAITLIQPNIMVKSTGMLADMNSGNIKLLSDAVGEYVPDRM